MIKCQTCRTENFDDSQYCDECGALLKNQTREAPPAPDFQMPEPVFQSASVTSIGIPPIAEKSSGEEKSSARVSSAEIKNVRAKLIVERGDGIGTEFPLAASESNIGRWDADNGIFPDVDLDKHDAEAKVSRRHARIVFGDGKFSIEDLGSTNGTFVNRGRRLLPGNAQPLSDGDEVIVGKTFLRFCVVE